MTEARGPKPSEPRAPLRGPAPMTGATRFMGGRTMARSKDAKRSGRRLAGLLRPQRRMLSAALGLGAVSVTFNVIGPRLLGRATDLIAAPVLHRGSTRGGIDFGTLRTVLLAALGVYLVSGLCWILQGRVMTGVVQRTVLRLRADVEAKLFRLPVRYFDRQPRGEVLSIATNDIDNIALTMQQSISQMTNSLLLVCGLLAMMFWLSPLLAAIALATVPLTIATTALIARRAQPQFADQWHRLGRLNAHIEEVYTGHVLVKVFGRQPEVMATLRAENDALYQAGYRAQFLSGTIQPAMALIGNLGYVLVAVVGGMRIASGALSIGAVQAMVQYSRQFGGPLTQVASLSNLIQSGIASAERVFELLDAPEQSTEPSAPDVAPEVNGRVCFESVSFRYTAEQPLIEDLFLTVEPGQTVAIVGPTGAGKTTLVNLLMRFYELDSGRITIDGVDIATLPRELLRSAVGMVLQDTWLFSGTIADNIGYGKDAATAQEIAAAARAAHAEHMIRTLPDGFDTVVDDDGTIVSAGEKQLITIARAFLSDPAILVLDEATSSVDTRTEVLLQQALARLSHGRTSFVIAHRLSTVRDADVILVMDAGAVVEQGTHEELLAVNGVYARLHAAQFAQPAAEV